jgi:hypothetical protein
MIAILEDAVHVYLGRWSERSDRKRPAIAAAEQWFASDDLAAPFSFLNVCHMLDLEPSAVRTALTHRRAANTGRPRAR